MAWLFLRWTGALFGGLPRRHRSNRGQRRDGQAGRGSRRRRSAGCATSSALGSRLRCPARTGFASVLVSPSPKSQAYDATEPPTLPSAEFPSHLVGGGQARLHATGVHAHQAGRLVRIRSRANRPEAPMTKAGPRCPPRRPEGPDRQAAEGLCSIRLLANP
jgi:hypothetical protein